MLMTILLLGLLLAATVTDVRWQRIPNRITYSGILAAFGVNAVGSLLLRIDWTSTERLWVSLGWIGLTQSLIGFLACGFILLACFVFFQVGGGDVKLIAMMGAMLGVDQGFMAMLWTFVLGGCMGLIVLIWRVGPIRLFTRVCRQVLWTLRLGRWSPLTPDERAQLQPPLFLAPCALAAAVIVRFNLVT